MSPPAEEEVTHIPHILKKIVLPVFAALLTGFKQCEIGLSESAWALRWVV